MRRPPGGMVADPGTEGDGVRTIGPTFTTDSLTRSTGAPKGATISFTMAARDSKVFPGNFSRSVGVFVPRQYVAGTPAPFVVSHDGDLYQTILTNTLENLIAMKKVPVQIAIFLGDGGGDGPGSQRGKEYDTVWGKQAEFIETEVLPRVEMELKTRMPGTAVVLTKDPEGRATLGGSSGGLAAFSVVWWHPELFRRMFGFSVSFRNAQRPVDPMYPHGGYEYGRIVEQTATVKPIRAWFAYGTRDEGSGENGDGNGEAGSVAVAASLQKKGYHYHFDHAQNSTHGDSRVTDQTFAEALVWLWRGYPVN